jgi:glycolate oxidase
MDDVKKGSAELELVRLIGRDRVLSYAADLTPFSMDTYRQSERIDLRNVPDFAVLPVSTAEVVGIVEIASKYVLPIITKGGGSNRTGMLVPLGGGILIDTVRMNHIIEVSKPGLSVTVQSGITLADLERHLDAFGLTLNQEQGSFKMATVGGSISTSGFSRKHQKYGAISNRVMSLEVVLSDGRVLRTGPKTLYTSTGYRLHDLFIGAEGTLGVITEATLRVEPIPEVRAAVLAFYDDFWAAFSAAETLMGSPVNFVGAEAYEIPDPERYGAPPERKGIFYVLFDGIKAEVDAEKSYVEKLIVDTGGLMGQSDAAKTLITKYVSQFCGARAVTGFEDVITSYVPLARSKEFYDELWNRIIPKYGGSPVPGEALSLDVGRYRMQGARFFLPKGEDCWERYQKILREVAELATRLGGTISACHGVGIEHRDLLVLEYSPICLDTMRSIKEVLDPKKLMNPGKMIPEPEVK